MSDTDHPEYTPLDELPPMEGLRLAISAADAGMRNLASPDPNVRMEAVLDFASLLAQAKRVVLSA